MSREELRREYNLETYSTMTDYDRKELWKWLELKMDSRDKMIAALIESSRIDLDSHNYAISIFQKQIADLTAKLKAAEEIIERWENRHMDEELM